MERQKKLLKRLDEIAASLAKTGHGLALLGLGSVGVELDRLDDYSDLDFFAIVEAGYKQPFIENLDWLSAIASIAFSFKNTPDGHKLMFEDGVFCEFAVFEPTELASIPFSAGRIVWKTPDFDEAFYLSPKSASPKQLNVAWLVGEAVTNLYVGLCRYRRGEKLSAARFIQGYALDRLVELSSLIETEQPAHRDEFTPERRYEQRFPITANELKHFMPGYEGSPQAAKAILEFLDQHFEVNAYMKKIIEDLCNAPSLP